MTQDNLEQGVKRYTASESSKTRLEGYKEDVNIEHKVFRIQSSKRQRVKTAKRRNSRQVIVSISHTIELSFS